MKKEKIVCVRCGQLIKGVNSKQGDSFGTDEKAYWHLRCPKIERTT